MSARQAAIPDPWEQLLPLPVQAPRELYMPELPVPVLLPVLLPVPVLLPEHRCRICLQERRTSGMSPVLQDLHRHSRSQRMSISESPRLP